MIKDIKSALTTYKRKMTIGKLFGICFVLIGIGGGQLLLMYAFEDNNIVWQGVCEGGALRNAGDNRTNMMVHCPGEEEFEINNPNVIVTYKDSGNAFYCRRTKGSIMKDEDWTCSTKGDN